MARKLATNKALLLMAVIWLSVSQINAQGYPGTNLRGQIQFYNPYYNNYAPLTNAIVDLYYSPSPNEFIFISQTITNNYGFYFFYAIQPGNGNYYIQVNRSKNYNVLVSPIFYYNNQYNYNQFQDLPILYY